LALQRWYSKWPWIFTLFTLILIGLAFAAAYYAYTIHLWFNLWGHHLPTSTNGSRKMDWPTSSPLHLPRRTKPPTMPTLPPRTAKMELLYCILKFDGHMFYIQPPNGCEIKAPSFTEPSEDFVYNVLHSSFSRKKTFA
jgi:hypothetical protein